MNGGCSKLLDKTNNTALFVLLDEKERFLDHLFENCVIEIGVCTAIGNRKRL